jgi:hypothetical protein
MSRRPAVNGSMTGLMIDQFPMAAVVVNCPPFKGALTACHPHRAIHSRHADDKACCVVPPEVLQGSKVSHSPCRPSAKGPACPSSTGARPLHAIALLAFHREAVALNRKKCHEPPGGLYDLLSTSRKVR